MGRSKQTRILKTHVDLDLFQSFSFFSTYIQIKTSWLARDRDDGECVNIFRDSSLYMFTIVYTVSEINDKEIQKNESNLKADLNVFFILCELRFNSYTLHPNTHPHSKHLPPRPFGLVWPTFSVPGPGGEKRSANMDGQRTLKLTIEAL